MNTTIAVANNNLCHATRNSTHVILRFRPMVAETPDEYSITRRDSHDCDVLRTNREIRSFQASSDSGVTILSSV